MRANLMKRITVREVEELINQKSDCCIVDVREKEEVEFGMIPGAINIPLSELQVRMNELEKDKEYIMVCQTGSRSGMATKYLNSLGYQASNMTGGMFVWKGDMT